MYMDRSKKTWIVAWVVLSLLVVFFMNICNDNDILKCFYDNQNAHDVIMVQNNRSLEDIHSRDGVLLVSENDEVNTLEEDGNLFENDNIHILMLTLLRYKLLFFWISVLILSRWDIKSSQKFIIEYIHCMDLPQVAYTFQMNYQMGLVDGTGLFHAPL